MAKNQVIRPPHAASGALTAVQKWAKFCYVLRETAAVMDTGRFDGLLIPYRWDATVKPGIHALEVKMTRADFQRGINSQQFERYQKYVNSLYLVTPHGICKKEEIPDGVGWLVVGLRDSKDAKGRTVTERVCICKRHAEVDTKKTRPEILWKVFFDLCDQFRRQQQHESMAIRKIHLHLGQQMWSKVERAIQDTTRSLRFTDDIEGV